MRSILDDEIADSLIRQIPSGTDTFRGTTIRLEGDWDTGFILEAPNTSILVTVPAGCSPDTLKDAIADAFWDARRALAGQLV